MESQFLRIAIQYYLAGRMAAFAWSFPVAGNLFHHAVEMLLKYSLLTTHSASQLKDRFEHNLKKLWREFKKIAGDPKLAKFDGVVSELNKVEELRYPKRSYVFAMDLQKVPRPPGPEGAMKNVKQYYVNLEEIDEFVTAMLTGLVNPAWFRGFLGAEAMTQYQRENRHPFI